MVVFVQLAFIRVVSEVVYGFLMYNSLVFYVTHKPHINNIYKYNTLNIKDHKYRIYNCMILLEKYILSSFHPNPSMGNKVELPFFKIYILRKQILPTSCCHTTTIFFCQWGNSSVSHTSPSTSAIFFFVFCKSALCKTRTKLP